MSGSRSFAAVLVLAGAAAVVLVGFILTRAPEPELDPSSVSVSVVPTPPIAPGRGTAGDAPGSGAARGGTEPPAGPASPPDGAAPRSQSAGVPPAVPAPAPAPAGPPAVPAPAPVGPPVAPVPGDDDADDLDDVDDQHNGDGPSDLDD